MKPRKSNKTEIHVIKWHITIWPEKEVIIIAYTFSLRDVSGL